MRIRSALGLALGSVLAVGGAGACTDGREASDRVGVEREPDERERAGSEREPAGLRNSDGSPKVLPPGPPSRPPHTLVLAYGDFGPPALASGLLGSEWWQWEGGGSWAIDDAFDVRVVVYRGIPLAAVQADYPTIEGRADYRYVSYEDAIAHFDRSMRELQDADEPLLRRLREELAVTRAHVRQALGAAAVER